MKKLRTEFEWKEKEKNLIVNEKIEMSSTDVFNKYREWTQAWNNINEQIKNMEEQKKEIAKRLKEIHPYFNMVKEEEEGKMIARMKKGKR